MTAPNELTYRRVHRAPRNLVFECMTKPEHLTHFWGPAGTTTPVHGIVVELRPGGAFETVIVNDNDGSTHKMVAVYEDVEPPERLVWREVSSGMRTAITFYDCGDGTTEVVTHQSDVPELYRSAAARTGNSTSVDRFDLYLVRLTATD